MSTTYETVSGDTFASIARKVYGDDAEAPIISKSNPGVIEPLSAGIILTTPVAPGAPVDKPQNADATGLSEVAVSIESERFTFWESVSITRSMDSISSIEMAAPFEADAPEFRNTFRPLSYKPIQVNVGGLPFFTGTMIGVDPVPTSSRKTLSISGYSTPGVMGDCDPPASSFPLEFNGQNLQQIATTVSNIFGISVIFEADAGPVFDRVAIEPDKKALEVLIGLAKQRNLVVSNTPEGDLLFQRSITSGTSVAKIIQGTPPFQTISATFKPQEYFSSITGIEPALPGLRGSQYTAANPRLAGVVRPFTFKADDTTGGSIKTAVDAKIARMFANVATYTLPIPSWRDSAGELWLPNTLISVEAPDAMIYSEFQFLIRSIEYFRSQQNEIATLQLVIPGSFDGTLPESLPWD